MTGLIVHTDTPFNAETPLDQLRNSFTTSQADFYVRSHGPIPKLSADTYKLTVRGLTTKPLELSMQEIRNDFPAQTVMAVMQCAGNRRADLHRLRPVMGDPWAGGAIGNATWTGASLADVLRAAGADTNPDLHVAFDASDIVPDQSHYGVSIPMTKALGSEVLLAYAMNHEPLMPQHGFPLRVVVPGFAGARSPKWLTTITVQDTQSANAMQQSDYKLLPPDMTPETVDWTKGITINELPLNATICEPASDAQIKAGPTRIRGYATVTGRTIQRVDVSTNGGDDWHQAELEHAPDAPWTWTLWQAVVDLPPGEHQLVVRAWDSAGQTQPASPADVWNFKGYLSAAWHRINIRAA